jgi:hypothetical protein
MLGGMITSTPGSALRKASARSLIPPMAPPVPEILSVSARAFPGNMVAPRIKGMIHATETPDIFPALITHASVPLSRNAAAPDSLSIYRHDSEIS